MSSKPAKQLLIALTALGMRIHLHRENQKVEKLRERELRHRGALQNPWMVRGGVEKEEKKLDEGGEKRVVARLGLLDSTKFLLEETKQKRKNSIEAR